MESFSTSTGRVMPKYLAQEQVAVHRNPGARRVLNLTAMAVVPMILALGLVFAGTSRAATAIGLGTAGSYGVLAGSGVTNTGPTVINGDLGTFPTPSVTGFGGAPNGTVNGAVHQGDAAASLAKDDLTTAYNNAAGQGPATTLATELGGETLTPGVYDSELGTFGITGALTLNAQGNPDAVFIFKTASTLITASSSQVNLINGAQACQVYWQVGSSATLGTSSDFVGNIFSLQSISLGNDVDVDGRLLARNGAVTLINDTVTRAQCATEPDPDPDPDPGPGPDPDPDPGPGPGPDPGPGPGPGPGPDPGPGPGPGTDPGPGPGTRPGPGRPSRSPNARIPQFPFDRSNPRRPNADIPGRPICVVRGFKARFRVRAPSGIRVSRVYVGSKLVKRTRSKRFSAWVGVRSLKVGRTTIRLVVIDRSGRRDVATRSFRRCARAVPSPSFTG